VNKRKLKVQVAHALQEEFALVVKTVNVLDVLRVKLNLRILLAAAKNDLS
jgi:ribosomal protein L23